MKWVYCYFDTHRDFYNKDYSYYRTELPRNKGGLGKMKIPILSDLTKDISRDYGILLEAGMSLRYVNILGTITVTV